VFLDRLIGSQLVTIFPVFYGTRRFITAFTNARHLSLSWASSIQSIPSHPTYQSTNPCLRLVFLIGNKTSFYGEKFSTPRPTPKLEGNPLSPMRDCLFNIFAATRHFGGRSSIRNLRTRHVVMTGTHLSRTVKYSYIYVKKFFNKLHVSAQKVHYQALYKCMKGSNTLY